VGGLICLTGLVLCRLYPASIHEYLDSARMESIKPEGVFIYMYIHMFICMYIYACIYIYKYAYMYIHTCIYVYLHMYLYMNI
jgi:hypothetical protein